MLKIIFNNPILCIILLLTLGSIFCKYAPTNNPSALHFICLVISVAVLIIGLFSVTVFNKAADSFQFVSYGNSFSGALPFGIDGVSLPFILLTLVLFPVCIMSVDPSSSNIKELFFYIIVLELLLILAFSSTHGLYFYIFFEGALIPMFLLVGKWGSRERRIRAAYVFFIFTFIGSLIMLLGIIYLRNIIGSNNLSIMTSFVISEENQRILWLCFFIAFAVKLPMYPFHSWLLEAHVEATAVVSMLLASLMLKLGGYGFLRFSIGVLPAGATYFNSVLYVLSLLGVFYASVAAIRQGDIKRLVAYSSIAHMNFALLGISSLTTQGVVGSIIVFVGHGVISASLFFCVGVLYKRYNTRLFRYCVGMFSVMPLFSSFLLFFTLSNMSFPGTPNFLGELFILEGVFSMNFAAFILSLCGVILSAIYSILFFNKISFGCVSEKYTDRFYDLDRLETTILAIFGIMAVIIGLNTSIIVDLIHSAVQFTLIG